jgi:hypothetical protein
MGILNAMLMKQDTRIRRKEGKRRGNVESRAGGSWWAKDFEMARKCTRRIFAQFSKCGCVRFVQEV